MEEADSRCLFNILHVCDYHGPYDSLARYVDYPGQVVNCSLQVGDATISAAEVEQLFGRPTMGGMDRHGVIATGDAAAMTPRCHGCSRTGRNALSLVRTARFRARPRGNIFGLRLIWPIAPGNAFFTCEERSRAGYSCDFAQHF